MTKTDFLAILAKGWNLIMERHKIFGHPFSYGDLALYLTLAGILCFLIRKGFFDN